MYTLAMKPLLQEEFLHPSPWLPFQLTLPIPTGFCSVLCRPLPFARSPPPNSGAQQHKKGEEMVNEGTILKNSDAGHPVVYPSLRGRHYCHTHFIVMANETENLQNLPKTHNEKVAKAEFKHSQAQQRAPDHWAIRSLFISEVGTSGIFVQ